MNSSTQPYAPPQDEEHHEYRTLSRSAVLSIVFGLLSGLGLIFVPLLVFPVVGMLMGLAALRSIRRFPGEVTGRPLARFGIALCGLLFVGGVTRHSYIYATECPEDCKRINFNQLQPDKRSSLPVSNLAMKLNGEKVFIKGYVHPGVQGDGPVKKFILVPDMGTCCFGGQPKLTDMVEVTLRDPHRIVYNRRKRKLAGILKVDNKIKPVSGLQGVYYQLDAYDVK